MKKKSTNILIAIFTTAFLIIGIIVRNTSRGILFDRAILDLIHRNENPILFPIMRFISFLGSAYFLILFMVGVLIYTLYRKEYYGLKLLSLATLGSFLLNHILKSVFQRTRPLDYFLVEQAGLSYPSGHSMVAMTFYMALAYLLGKNIEDYKKKKLIYISAAIMIGLMGMSRLYLGVHWPSDVLGGYLVGYVFFILSRRMIKDQ